MIQQRIHAKTSFAIMGVELGGDDGLSVEEEEDKDKDEEEDEEGGKKNEVVVNGNYAENIF